MPAKTKPTTSKKKKQQKRALATRRSARLSSNNQQPTISVPDHINTTDNFLDVVVPKEDTTDTAGSDTSSKQEKTLLTFPSTKAVSDQAACTSLTRTHAATMSSDNKLSTSSELNPNNPNNPQSTKSDLPKTQQNIDHDDSLLHALKEHIDSNNSALKTIIDNSIHDSSQKLRCELKADMNFLLETHKKEWADFKDVVTKKVKTIEADLKARKTENDRKIALLEEKIDNLMLSLDKDKIESLKSIDNTTLQSLKHQGERFANLNKRMTDDEQKITELTNSAEFSSRLNEEILGDIKTLKHEGSMQENRMNTIEINQGRTNSVVNSLQASTEASEIRQRKMNLVFEGVPEVDNENTKQEILNLLRKSSLITPPSHDQIDTAYRLGRKVEGTMRSILVVFKDLHTKDNVLNNAPSIRKSTNSKTLWINRDHPELTRRQITNTRKCYNLMRSNNHECRLSGTSITYNNRVYQYKDLNSLPEGSRLEDTRLIPCLDGKGLCFQGDLCYVSNLYPCPIQYNKIPFMSAEQAFQWDKATAAGDYTTAREILECTSSFKAKSLGSQVTPPKAWLSKEEETLKSIVKIKFKQNKHLGTRLKDSGFENFYECTRDTKWGTGVTVSTRQVDTSLFFGENKFGKILGEIKASLQLPETKDN